MEIQFNHVFTYVRQLFYFTKKLIILELFSMLMVIPSGFLKNIIKSLILILVLISLIHCLRSMIQCILLQFHISARLQ